MAAQQFPVSFPTIAPAFDDLLLFADVDTANTNSVNTVEDIVKAWLSASTTDDLPQGATNLYFTLAGQIKLAWIAPWAQVNSVFTVNGLWWAVILDQDDILDWTTYKQTENNFSNTKLTELNTAFAHVSNLSNPHAVTNVQVGLWNVTNDSQLKRSAGDFSTFPQKVSLHPADHLLIEDSVDSLNKKYVEVIALVNEVIWNLPGNLWASLEVSWWLLQFKNDTATPPEDSFYGNEEWTLGYYSKYDKNVYGWADIVIPTWHTMVVHWWLSGFNSIVWPGGLYIL